MENNNGMGDPFHALRVLEIAGSVAGAYCARRFADLGASVLRVEQAASSDVNATQETSRSRAMDLAWHRGKDRLHLDFNDSEDRARIEKLCSRADVIIESSSSVPLKPISVSIDGLDDSVRVYISIFGTYGPDSELPASEFVSYAAGGYLFLNGMPDREPLQYVRNQSAVQAAMHAYIGALTALMVRTRGDGGQVVDVAQSEGLLHMHQFTTVRYMLNGSVLTRDGNNYHGAGHPITLYQCADGWVSLTASTDPQAQNLLLAAGAVEAVEDERFQNGPSRYQNQEAFDAAIRPWLQAHSVEHVVRECQAFRVPAERVYSIWELLGDEHLASREFWEEVPGADDVKRPGPPYRIAEGTIRRAPTAEVRDADAESLREWLPMESDRLTVVKDGGVSRD